MNPGESNKIQVGITGPLIRSRSIYELEHRHPPLRRREGIAVPVLLVAALIIALALAACGGGDAADSGGEGAGSTSRAEATDRLLPNRRPRSRTPRIHHAAGSWAAAAARPPSTEEGEATPETDREALIALYNATDGENWYHDNWLTGEPLDQWERVNTDDNGRVIELILGGNN